MNSKERVLKALNHEQPDRIPIDFGATLCSGMHVKVVDALRKHYKLEDRLVKTSDPYQMLGLIEEDLQEAIGVDVISIDGIETIFGFKNENWKEWEMHDGLKVAVSEHFKTVKDEKGAYLIFPQGDTSAPPSGRMPRKSPFFDVIERKDKTFDDENLNPEENLEEFALFTDEDIEYYRKEADRLADSEKAVLIDPGSTALGDIAMVPGPNMKYPKGIRSTEDWYMATIARQDYIHEIFEKQMEIALQNLEKLNDGIGQYNIDVFFVCGSDYGTQTSQFCDAGTFRSLYFPYYKKVNDWIHKNTRWKTFKHCCGSIRNLIPLMIECGFDILNPVQVSAANMDAAELKNEFGKDITFWGGGVDTQNTLMFGTTEEVRKEVLERCEIFGKDGGFVFNSIHNVQANVPIENVVAMIDAVHEFNGVRVT